MIRREEAGGGSYEVTGETKAMRAVGWPVRSRPCQGGQITIASLPSICTRTEVATLKVDLGSIVGEE